MADQATTKEAKRDTANNGASASVPAQQAAQQRKEWKEFITFTYPVECEIVFFKRTPMNSGKIKFEAQLWFRPAKGLPAALYPIKGWDENGMASPMWAGIEKGYLEGKKIVVPMQCTCLEPRFSLAEASA